MRLFISYEAIRTPQTKICSPIYNITLTITLASVIMLKGLFFPVKILCHVKRENLKLHGGILGVFCVMQINVRISWLSMGLQLSTETIKE